MKLNYEEIVNNYVVVLQSTDVKVMQIETNSGQNKTLFFQLFDKFFNVDFNFNTGTYRLVIRDTFKYPVFDKKVGIYKNLFELMKEIKYES